MTDIHHLPTVTTTIILGWLASGYGWLFEGMPGIAILIAVTTLILTCVKLKAAWDGRGSKPAGVALED
jgi:hypothetical protein